MATIDVDSLEAVIIRKIEELNRKARSFDRLELTRLNDDGWMRDPYQWIYASANSFTITESIDVSNVYEVGTKIRCKQGAGYLYFYVTEISAAYIGGNYTVTVTINGGSDYSLANAAITDSCYSFVETPESFPHWFNWTPAFTGFSADPAGGIYRFFIAGRTCTCFIRMPNNGTSDDTDFTITAPVTAVTIADMRWSGPASIIDSGVNPGTPGRAYLPSGSNIITITKDYSTGTWTNSGDKSANFHLIYEI